MIELQAVSVLKSGKKLFEEFSFRVEKGEHWVIQGDNGSGKTTLLQLLGGALPPFSGRVHHRFLEGDDWDTRYRERKEKIHFIPTHWLQLFLSGFDGLFYQERYYSVEEIDLPKVRDIFGENIHRLPSLKIFKSFDIDGMLDLHVTRLSNGQLKKVIILRQLTQNIPLFLLLDYPFDGLDAESRRDLSDFLDELVRQLGIQLIIVDHGPSLPKAINRRLTLKAFTIENIEEISEVPPAMPPRYVPEKTVPHSKSKIPVVEMVDLTISYGGKTIISKLNWQINKGERWALTGRNGSGKTTLFSLIYADHPMAYSQKVFLFGRRRGTGESIWDIKNRINYFGPEQVHFLDPKAMQFTGTQYVLMQPHTNTHRFRSLVEFFDAHSWVDKPVRHLSSGQLQLLLLIKFFLDDKELLLLDEPFQFLDPHHHASVTEYLNQYLNPETTLVLITHNESDVERWTNLRKRI